MPSYTTTLFALLQASSVLVAAKTHKVTVGPGLMYTPNTTTAAVGDMIAFDFIGGHHTVTEGSMTSACMPSSDTAFYSGEVTPNATFTLTINDTNPIYYFCSTPTHCKDGMVGAINPASGGLEAYLTSAKASTSEGAPAQAQGGTLKADSAKSNSTSSANSSSTSSGAKSTTKSTTGTGSSTATTTGTSTRSVAAQTTNLAAHATPFLGGLAAAGLLAFAL